MKLKKPTAGLATGAEVLLPLLLSQTAVWTERAALRQVADQAASTLALCITGLHEMVGKYEALPRLLARDPTLAASNWDGPTPTAGQNYSYRRYFRDAMQGQLGRHVALGTASGKRGYDFADPVHGADGGVPGAIVVKVLLERDRLPDSACGTSRSPGPCHGPCYRC